MVWLVGMSMAAMLVVLIVAYVVWVPRWQEAQILHQRLQQWAKPESSEEPLNLLQEHKLSDIPWLDQFLRRIPASQHLEQLRKQAGNTVSTGTWLLLSGLLGFGFYLGVSQTLPLPLYLTIGLALVGSWLPFLYLKFQKGQRLRKFEQQFPEALDMLTRTIQAGHSLILGMQLVGDEFSDPLGPEFKRTVEQVQRWGIPFQEAMVGLTERIDSLDLRYFTVAVNIQREAGGNLTEILEALSNLIRKRFELQDRVKALSAEGKMSAMILFALPFFLGIAMSMMNPTYLEPLFATETGTFLLGLGVTMMCIGGLVIRKMIAFKV